MLYDLESSRILSNCGYSPCSRIGVLLMAETEELSLEWKEAEMEAGAFDELAEEVDENADELMAAIGEEALEPEESDGIDEAGDGISPELSSSKSESCFFNVCRPNEAMVTGRLGALLPSEWVACCVSPGDGVRATLFIFNPQTDGQQTSWPASHVTGSEGRMVVADIFVTGRRGRRPS
ncbi:unnamed protein product [Protopolystoma xenopodis]|uniref:Uncharacterized protein n=1 Tax=Protopolystoma xenopodis TaxID=117903 RepID=A0A3S5B8C0_9PLAT|nr:unnamed protein product [Protopolystoma xenopodis]